MAFTRFKDDPARVNKYLEETTSIGKYHLNTPGNGLANPYIDDCHIILQKWGANLQSNSLLVENELRNLNRPLTRDINTYRKVDSQMYQYPSKHFNIDGIILFDDKFDMNILTKETYKSRIDAMKDNYDRVSNMKIADDCFKL
jgi:hypothetical protein